MTLFFFFNRKVHSTNRRVHEVSTILRCICAILVSNKWHGKASAQCFVYVYTEVKGTSRMYSHVFTGFVKTDIPGSETERERREREGGERGEREEGGWEWEREREREEGEREKGERGWERDTHKTKLPETGWPWWLPNSKGAHILSSGWEFLWWQKSRRPVCRYSWWPYSPSVHDGEPRATTPTTQDTSDTRHVHKYTRCTRHCQLRADIFHSRRDVGTDEKNCCGLQSDYSGFSSFLNCMSRAATLLYVLFRWISAPKLCTQSFDNVAFNRRNYLTGWKMLCDTI